MTPRPRSPSPIRYLPILAMTALVTPIHAEEKSDGAKRKWPDKIGPFALENETSQSSIGFGFAAQGQFQLDSLDQGPEEDRSDEYTFRFRRMRPSLQGSALTDHLTYKLQLNTAPGALELVDLFIDYRFLTHVRVRLGQSNVPFTRYRWGSFTKLTLVDWAITARAFGSERQRGVTLHNGVKMGTPVTYALGVYSGENARKSNAMGVADVYGERPGNQSDLANPAEPGGVHPEIAAFLAYNYGDIDTSIDTDLEGGPLRFSVAFSAAYDIRPDPYVDFSHRLAPEFLLKVHGFSLASVLYVGFTENLDDPFSYRHAMSGALVQASYIALNRLELAVRYAFVSTGKDILNESQERAQTEIDSLEQEIARIRSVDTTGDPIRADELAQRASDLESDIGELEEVGTLGSDHELTLGFNVFIIGTSLRWQTDVSWLRHAYTSGDRNDVRMRTQLTLAF